MTFDPTRPSQARIADFLHDGRENFTADRTAVEQTGAWAPRLKAAAAHHRAFRWRLITHLVRDCGIQQLLDIGCGYPALANVHEIARAQDPSCRVLYVDNDPHVARHALVLLGDGHNGVDTLQADLRHPQDILTNQAWKTTFDPAKPIGLLVLDVLHHCPHNEPVQPVQHLISHLPPGSYVAVSHLTTDGLPAEHRHVFTQISCGPWYARSQPEVLALLDGLDLDEHGVTATTLWRPGPDDVPADLATALRYAAVARKP